MSETIKVKVMRKTIDGVKYYIDIADNMLYNMDKEEVGIWDEESKTIKPLPDDDEDEDEDEEEEDDMEDIMFEGKVYVKEKSSGDIYSKGTNQIIGTWNEKKKRIDFDKPDESVEDLMSNEYDSNYIYPCRFTMKLKKNADGYYEIKDDEENVVSYLDDGDVNLEGFEEDKVLFDDLEDIGMPLIVDIQHTYKRIAFVGLNLFAGNNGIQVKKTPKIRYPIYWNGRISTKIEEDDTWQNLGNDGATEIKTSRDNTTKPIGSIQIEIQDKFDDNVYTKKQIENYLIRYVNADAYQPIMKKSIYPAVIKDIEEDFLDKLGLGGKEEEEEDTAPVKKKEKKVKEKKEKVVAPAEPVVDVLSVKVKEYKKQAEIYKTKKASYETKKTKELKIELIELKSVIEKLLEEIKALKEGKGLIGGKLERDELKGLLDASYDGRERVGDWVIDKQLSTNTSKVYSKGDRAVVSHKGTEGITDWGNNLAFAVGGEYLYKKTDRFKEAKKVQKAAEKKYGAKNVSTIGHSQGGLQAELLGSKSKEIITLNKASHPLISRKSGNQTDIRSDRDIVSIATKTPTTEIKAESYNPLTEHSIDILDRVSKDTQYGKGINNPNLYQQVKDAADIIYEKPSAYKSGFIVKKYKELGGTYSGKKDNKGIGRWFKEEWKDVGNKEYPVFRPTKIVTKDTPLTPEEIKPSNLKKQIALKQEIKGDANLPPFEPKTGGMVVSLGQSADNISEYDEVYKYSNPKKVQEKAKKYLGEGGIIYRSISKGKKYMVYNPNDKKWVHFGALNYEDHTKHMDEKRRQSYLKRSANIKGDWKDDKYSPNNLARNLLW